MNYAQFKKMLAQWYMGIDSGIMQYLSGIR